MKRTDREAGGRKNIRNAAAVAAFCLMLGFGEMTSPAQNQASKGNLPAEDREEILDINNGTELKQWYEGLEQGNSSSAVLKTGMVIAEPMIFGPIAGQGEGSPVKLILPDGPVIVTAPRAGLQEGFVINNPNLIIVPSKNSVIYIRDKGCLVLKQGSVDNAEDRRLKIVLEGGGELVWKQGGGFKGMEETDVIDNRTDPPETVPPDGNQSGAEAGGTQPQLTEAVLLNVGSDGSGSARLEFKNLPADINALYIFRSGSGHSWTKEKNKVTAASSQSGQETVEYENFLKESGNTLNTGIVEDGFLVYRFQSDNASFYVKARIEWPGGSYETDKVKIAIPETAGKGLTFGYGWDSYGSGYSGGYGNSYGGGSGSGGSSGNSTTGAEDETDAPEAPVRGRGGRRRGSDSPYTYTGPVYNQTEPLSGEKPREATPSDARGSRGKDGGGRPADEMKDLTQENDTEAADGTGAEAAVMESDPVDEAIQDQPDPQNNGYKRLFAAAAALLAIGGGAAYIYRRKRR